MYRCQVNMMLHFFNDIELTLKLIITHHNRQFEEVTNLLTLNQ